MAYNRAAFSDSSPKLETVFTKTSIQREYLIKQTSLDALNTSPLSPPNEDVTSDSFFAHGFHQGAEGQNLPPRDDKLDSLQSEATISNYEREIQETAERLRSLSSDFIDRTTEVSVQRESADRQFSTSESTSRPTTKSTLFKSFFERSRDGRGERTTCEVSAERGFDERGIDDAFADKQLLAHSTKKISDSTPKQHKEASVDGAFDESKSASKDIFARYGNLSDATRSFFKPFTWFILALLALLLALVIVGLLLYLRRESQLNECLARLKEPLDDFCALEQHPMRLGQTNSTKSINSEPHRWFNDLRTFICFEASDHIDFATNRTVNLLDSVNKNLWPTVHNVTYFASLLRGEPFRFKANDRGANATVQLLKEGTHERFYLIAMEKAVEAQENLKNADDREWMIQEKRFYNEAECDKTLSKNPNKTTVISYGGSPDEFYWSLRLQTRCKTKGPRKIVNYSLYRSHLTHVLELMDC